MSGESGIRTHGSPIGKHRISSAAHSTNSDISPVPSQQPVYSFKPKAECGANLELFIYSI